LVFGHVVARLWISSAKNALNLESFSQS